MLLVEETLEEFGVDTNKLSEGSSKKVKVRCDYCSRVVDVVFKNRNMSYKKLPKDACKDCRYIKREEIGNNPFSRPEVKEKIKQTNLKKYGTEHWVQTEEFKEKQKKTNLEKYGVEHASQSEEIKIQKEQTILERYGVTNPSLSKELQQKKKETFLERYGAESYFGSEEGKEVSRAAIKEKFGVDNVFQLEEIKEKSKQTNLEKYGYEHRIQDPEFAKVVGQKSLKTKIENGQVKLIEGKLVSEWIGESKCSKTHFYALEKKHGKDFAMEYSPRVTAIEMLIEKLLCDLAVKHQKQFKVETYKADFFLPEHNIVVEANGNYWHSEKFAEKNYHRNKRSLYLKYGYKSLFFTEDEIEEKLDIIQSIILNKIGQSTRLFARKCNFIEVDATTGKRFMNQNHLMGNGAGKYYGLENNGTLYSLIQIKNITDGWKEISRFCNLNNHTVVGGLSKLIKHTSPSKLKTFIDLRYGSGEYLKSLGFKEGKAHLSFSWTDGNQRFHRMRFPNGTGYDHNLVKLWDCGQKPYFLH